MVLITYNPEYELLNKCIKSIHKNIRNIYIIDNGSDYIYKDKNFSNIIFKNLGKNMGIAYAQNIGLIEAIKNKADYVLISDQDTIYPKNYINSMLTPFFNNTHICAVAPLFKKSITKKNTFSGFYKKNLFAIRPFSPESGFHDTFQVIASGKIIKTEYLPHIGLMNTDLFIDWVDFEWCWRAQKKGYKIMGNADVVIKHQLGDISKNIGFKEVNLRSPIRHYYITRNAFHLALRDKSLDRLHKITLFFKSFRYIIGYPILSKPHLTHLKYVLLGFWHGITGKLGKLNEKN